MSLRAVCNGLIILAGVSLTLTSFITHAEVKAEVSAQDKLLVLTNNYQKICTSQACQDQLIQLKKYGRWGDAKSQLVVGSSYLYGDGVEQDIDKAISWLKRTAYNESSNAAKYSLHAFHIMAQLYQKGIGVEQDLSLANKYLDKLAEKNYGPVLFNRAFIEFEQSNLAKGITLLEQASESYFAEASYYLARMYQQGDFIDKDIKKSALYYEKVVRGDYKDSRQRLEKIISELEENSRKLTASTLTEEQTLINKLNATLDIEVITVNSYSMKIKDPMTNLIVRLKQNSAKFAPSTGSRIRGRTCGQTSYPCKGMSSEDIDDARNESRTPDY
ncbi:hypothetical protein CXF85_09785 [Colwellia sp. 75C3]|uniref:tetratricopeptide repeat protein n=1 Tax=Colwellia sp. 75C3 TaxID=888425 RepID=UPI000C31E5A4|nr:tetratricopeptide repeat protein [Colwellia sp. 75C3]PKG83786.1 hypothetical protein CXF85_09785 [Colwellia sp. 75C3]